MWWDTLWNAIDSSEYLCTLTKFRKSQWKQIKAWSKGGICKALSLQHVISSQLADGSYMYQPAKHHVLHYKEPNMSPAQIKPRILQQSNFTDLFSMAWGFASMSNALLLFTRQSRNSFQTSKNRISEGITTNSSISTKKIGERRFRVHKINTQRGIWIYFFNIHNDSDLGKCMLIGKACI